MLRHSIEPAPTREMIMSPEYLTALASIGTFVVIAVTAIAAVVQLRHIRAGNQLAGILKYTEWWESDAIQDAIAYVERELPAKLRDPGYRQELFQRNVHRRKHLELVAGDWCEQMGSYVKYGMIDKNQFIDLAGSYIENMWSALKEVVAIRRVVAGQAFYENFEYLAALTAQWSQRHKGGNYPRNVKRLMSEQEARSLAGAPAGEQPSSQAGI